MKLEKAIVRICFRVRTNKKEGERWRNIETVGGEKKKNVVAILPISRFVSILSTWRYFIIIYAVS